MTQVTRPIEEFFLESLLRICIISTSLIILASYYFTRFADTRLTIINFAILLALISAFALYKFGYFKSAVLLISFTTIPGMFYQTVMSSSITSTSMTVVIATGFVFSVLLTGRLPWVLHGLTIIGMMVVFIWMGWHPTRYGKLNADTIILVGVAYVVLYIIIGYTSKLLKERYDETVVTLASKNLELIESRENLSRLNTQLESIVEARTKQVQQQNEQLINYAYSNAHHVRGPVARLLGLVQLSKIDTIRDYPFLFQKIEEETKQIDEVVKRINKELEQ